MIIEHFKIFILKNVVWKFQTADVSDISLEDEFLQDEPMALAMQSRTFYKWTSFYKLLKVALRTLKGLNCSIQGVMNMKEAALNFPTNIQNCGVNAGKELQKVINACQDIVTMSDDIINLRSKYCGNPDDETDENAASTTKCIAHMAKKIYKLNNKLKDTVNLIKKVPAIPGAAGQCMQDELNNLTTTFTGFPAFIQSCSQLTS